MSTMGMELLRAELLVAEDIARNIAGKTVFLRYLTREVLSMSVLHEQDNDLKAVRLLQQSISDFLKLTLDDMRRPSSDLDGMSDVLDVS
jgi:hypothetical protein